MSTLRTVGPLAALLCVIFASALEGKPPPNQPGTYQDWDGTLDQVTIVRSFKSASYGRIVVPVLETKAVQLPSAKDNTFKAVKEVLGHSTEKFSEGIKRDLRDKQKLVRIGEPQGADELIIRGRVLTMDPGSQAARYWAGFSAGAARVMISGEIIDGRTKTVLVRFKQERRSGAGLLGGGYHAVLDRSLREIGEDVASLLNAM